MEAIGTRVYSELATVQMHKDVLEGEILKEMDNGRLLRLLVGYLIWRYCFQFSPRYSI